jgi:uncharacterized protein YjbI with pentapeptide repeats
MEWLKTVLAVAFTASSAAFWSLHVSGVGDWTWSIALGFVSLATLVLFCLALRQADRMRSDCQNTRPWFYRPPRTGTQLLSRYRKGHRYFADSQLQRANLQGRCLRFANLSNADLVGADLSGADLRDACIRDRISPRGRMVTPLFRQAPMAETGSGRWPGRGV